ncbi:MAG: hypothetical protein PHX68_00785 [Alphaproteobacteria bacterium]|nr:hypothetical protein [Alphaproteobacteria bacterium]
MKIYFAHASSIDYSSLYDGIVNSEELKPYKFYFPHLKKGSGEDSFDIIPTCDLFIADVSAPSTGLGIEIGRAEANNIPILLLSKIDAKISTSFDFIHPRPIRLIYSNPQDMAQKIIAYLNGQLLK